MSSFVKSATARAELERCVEAYQTWRAANPKVYVGESTDAQALVWRIIDAIQWDASVSHNPRYVAKANKALAEFRQLLNDVEPPVPTSPFSRGAFLLNKKPAKVAGFRNQ